jgi:hypothetical protein
MGAIGPTGRSSATVAAFDSVPITSVLLTTPPTFPVEGTYLVDAKPP